MSRMAGDTKYGVSVHQHESGLMHRVSHAVATKCIERACEAVQAAITDAGVRLGGSPDRLAWRASLFTFRV